MSESFANETTDDSENDGYSASEGVEAQEIIEMFSHGYSPSDDELFEEEERVDPETGKTVIVRVPKEEVRDLIVPDDYEGIDYEEEAEALRQLRANRIEGLKKFDHVNSLLASGYLLQGNGTMQELNEAMFHIAVSEDDLDDVDFEPSETSDSSESEDYNSYGDEDEVDDTVTVTVTVEVYVCPFCKDKFQGVSALREHVNDEINAATRGTDIPTTKPRGPPSPLLTNPPALCPPDTRYSAPTSPTPSSPALSSPALSPLPLLSALSLSIASPLSLPSPGPSSPALSPLALSPLALPPPDPRAPPSPLFPAPSPERRFPRIHYPDLEENYTMNTLGEMMKYKKPERVVAANKRKRVSQPESNRPEVLPPPDTRRETEPAPKKHKTTKQDAPSSPHTKRETSKPAPKKPKTVKRGRKKRKRKCAYYKPMSKRRPVTSTKSKSENRSSKSKSRSKSKSKSKSRSKSTSKSTSKSKPKSRSKSKPNSKSKSKLKSSSESKSKLKSKLKSSSESKSKSNKTDQKIAHIQSRKDFKRKQTSRKKCVISNVKKEEMHLEFIKARRFCGLAKFVRID